MDVNDQAQGRDRACVIVGLGNPGEKYRGTRHNLGFLVVEELAKRRDTSIDRLVCNALVSRDETVMLAEPQTYMNRSGYSARCLAERYELNPSDFLIVYDDVSLPLGKVRFRAKGSPGGHRGMESVVHNLRTEEVPRLRLGIGGEDGSPSGDLVDFVLSDFERSEQPIVEEMVLFGAARCEDWIRDGFATSGSVVGS